MYRDTQAETGVPNSIQSCPEIHRLKQVHPTAYNQVRQKQMLKSNMQEKYKILPRICLTPYQRKEDTTQKSDSVPHRDRRKKKVKAKKLAFIIGIQNRCFPMHAPFAKTSILQQSNRLTFSQQ